MYIWDLELLVELLYELFPSLSTVSKYVNITQYYFFLSLLEQVSMLKISDDFLQLLKLLLFVKYMQHSDFKFSILCWFSAVQHDTQVMKNDHYWFDWQDNYILLYYT